MQTIHQVNNHVVEKMHLDINFYNIESNIQTITPTYFLTKNIPIKIHSFIKIKHNFKYQCTSCAKPSKKNYSGFCYVCLMKKPEADTCIMSPHRCHYTKGTCRSDEFAETFCYQPHYLYLAFTDKYKIGLTRHSQIPIRWIDQGALMASAFMKTYSRHQAGIIEKFLMQKWSDKTHWQNMLKRQNSRPSVEEFIKQLDQLKSWISDHEIWQSGQWKENMPSNINTEPETSFLSDTNLWKIEYPLLNNFPEKIQALKLDSSPLIEGTVIGIKGQYIILDNGCAINIRNHTGFIIDFELTDQ